MARSHPLVPPLAVVIVGGGVAALETLTALSDLAGERVSVTLVAPEPEYAERPMAVAVPFAAGHPQRRPLWRIADDFGARRVVGRIAKVDPDRQLVHCEDGTALSYDALVIATGARRRPAVRHALTFDPDHPLEAMSGLLADIEQGYCHRVAFVAGDQGWTLPLYELAIMTARDGWSMGVDDVRYWLVTPEPAPLALFGPRAADAVRAMLEPEGIEFVGSTYPDVEAGAVNLNPAGGRLEVDRIVALPTLEGPAIPGLPADQRGFLPTDQHGRVIGTCDVYAAGDGTTFPIKQGGLATQQADAVAQAIAADAGAAVVAEPFRPVLRGVLLTGGRRRYLRHGVSGGDGDGEVADRALWWPPAKVAGRYLAPYLLGPTGAEAAKADAPAGPRLRIEIPLAPPRGPVVDEAVGELLGPVSPP